MAWQRFDPEQGQWVTIPDEFGGMEGDRQIPNTTQSTAYSGAGEWSGSFGKPNDFSNAVFYGAPGSVGKMLEDAAQRAGVSGYDFNQAAAKAAPGYGWALPGASGWQLGANEEQIYRQILQNSDNPALQALANERNQTAYDTGARAGVQRDAELAARNAADSGSTGDLMKLAALAAAIYSGGSLAGLWGAGASTAGGLTGGLAGLTEAELAAAGAGLGSGIEGAAIAAGPTMGLSSMGGSGLMNFLNADAASSAGLGAAGAGSGAMDTSWFEPWMDAATGGGDIGTGGYTIDMSGRAIDAAGNVVNGTDGGISDFIKGAIQSGNLSELAKVLPSIPGGSTALKSLFGGSDGSSSGTGSSLWDILGRAAPGLLGAYASNQQTNAMTDLANKFSEYGAPSRARYEASMTPGFDPTSIAGYQGALDTASQSILRKLSATGGNPYGNPGGLIEANKQIVAGTALPAIQQYQNQNANTGGLGALAAAYPSTQQAATQSGADVYNALGSAVGNVVNPPQTASQSLADIYKLINSGMKAA